jgi:hypothetical protein
MYFLGINDLRKQLVFRNNNKILKLKKKLVCNESFSIGSHNSNIPSSKESIQEQILRVPVSSRQKERPEGG